MIYSTKLSVKSSAYRDLVEIQATHEVRGDKALEVSYMTYAQKMMDERRMEYMDGLEEGMEKGVEKGMEKAIIALRGVLDPAVMAERFKMSVDQVMDILGQK